jgi:NAD(P)-dependent dehydrogenase (short-subunit alcohol dehydrogenase family)
MCHEKYNQSLVSECEIKTFDELLNINVRSTMHILSLSVPFLKLIKGNYIILSSMESFIPVNYGFLNSMTKSMINSLIQCSPLELDSFSIRINGVDLWIF